MENQAVGTWTRQRTPEGLLNIRLDGNLLFTLPGDTAPEVLHVLKHAFDLGFASGHDYGYRNATQDIGNRLHTIGLSLMHTEG